MKKVICFGALRKIGELKNVIVTFLIVSFFERIRPDAESILLNWIDHRFSNLGAVSQEA